MVLSLFSVIMLLPPTHQQRSSGSVESFSNHDEVPRYLFPFLGYCGIDDKRLCRSNSSRHSSCRNGRTEKSAFGY